MCKILWFKDGTPVEKEEIVESCLVVQQVKDLCSDLGHCCDVGLVPGPGTSTCCGYSREGEKERERGSWNKTKQDTQISVYMYVCMYVCMYMCIHTHTHTHIYNFLRLHQQHMEVPRIGVELEL